MRKRPRVDFTQQERATELKLLANLKTAKRFEHVVPQACKDAQKNLDDLYAMVEARYRSGK